ncbi:GGDEF domain-containing protein [Colwellia sp. 1_MG-2023]|uniref:GGDEF domain-containing protein n=1 Tax=Colwellia sp. 1_MG-2023 TaxID=3062649 RepID=UPI0026E46A96|nr:GGDEF domain-containing protein [Colwellia sp. 1_MG-2023]MDO6445046.1 GGDEF domain-containing protein [Colwellia sp. 1_MG-2023]
MGSQFEIALSVIIVSIVMFIASLLFKDKEGDKPARLAFRAFYFCTVIFFVVMSANIRSSTLLLDFFSDVFFALTGLCLTIGILWRCQSKIPLSFVCSFAVIYVITDRLVIESSVQVAYFYSVVNSLLCVYALLKRTQGSNVGDKGMALVILLNTILLLANLASFTGIISHDFSTQFMVTLFIFAPAYLAGLTIFLFSSYMLDAHKALEIEATTDPLTELYNRRFFFSESKRILSVAERHQEPLCIMMCDIDFFKKVNDNYGHKVGDKVLKKFAETLNKSLRSGDILARYGGEEFVALLTQTDKTNGFSVVDRMREQIENLSIETEKGSINLTASFGLCEVKEFQDIEVSINLADNALYNAKSAGRNVVKYYEHSLA